VRNCPLHSDLNRIRDLLPEQADRDVIDKTVAYIERLLLGLRNLAGYGKTQACGFCAHYIPGPQDGVCDLFGFKTALDKTCEHWAKSKWKEEPPL